MDPEPFGGFVTFANLWFLSFFEGGGYAEKFPPNFIFFNFKISFLFCEALKGLLALVIRFLHHLPPGSDVKKVRKNL